MTIDKPQLAVQAVAVAVAFFGTFCVARFWPACWEMDGLLDPSGGSVGASSAEAPPVGDSKVVASV